MARSLARELEERGLPVRLVGRTPTPLKAGAEVVVADLTDPESTEHAVAKSEVCYLTAGLPYRAKTWERNWPQIMGNVIAACAKHNARLVFFDNVYMYDPSYLGHMTEETPIRPISRKGRVRAEIAYQLIEATKRGVVEALIARSADFYGFGRPATGILNFLAFEPLASGKSAMWIADVNYPHSFTYLSDIGKSLAVLGNSDEAYGEVWHLPTSTGLTGREWVNQIADFLGAEPRVKVISPFMARFAGLFSPLVREMVEMFYQYDRPYFFDSSKIKAAYNLMPTPPDIALHEVCCRDYGKCK